MKRITEKRLPNAVLRIEDKAWMSIMYLVMSQEKEIGWRGFISSPEPGVYTLKNITIYPQEVGVATVEVNEKDLANWEEQLDDKEFNTMRLHGHSHVNFGTSPSSTDREHQKKIVDMLKINDYYIFIIVNKKLNINVDIFDKRNNTWYENEDVDVWLPRTCEMLNAEINDLVKEKKRSIAEPSFIEAIVPRKEKV